MNIEENQVGAGTGIAIQQYAITTIVSHALSLCGI